MIRMFPGLPSENYLIRGRLVSLIHVNPAGTLLAPQGMLAGGGLSYVKATSPGRAKNEAVHS